MKGVLTEFQTFSSVSDYTSSSAAEILKWRLQVVDNVRKVGRSRGSGFETCIDVKKVDPKNKNR